MNYCLIDESDPDDFLECEGHVLKTFFASSGIFCAKQSLELIRKDNHIENSLKRNKTNYFNIVQFSAHGGYQQPTRTKLAYTSIVKRRGNKKDVEIFRPDSIVRTGLEADIFLSTNCQTFNPMFIDTFRHYKGISNFIAPVNSPYIGNTLIFSIMFYNTLLRKVGSTNSRISDKSIIEAFLQCNAGYKKYCPIDQFRLYNQKTNKIYK
ncbi:MAG: hypothetical protein K0S26_1415 [Bacteroidota bacterium]|jgi:hypothetical protein|nr:hypothetical protein [Bacteroidota bacterium]